MAAGRRSRRTRNAKEQRIDQDGSTQSPRCPLSFHDSADIGIEAEASFLKDPGPLQIDLSGDDVVALYYSAYMRDLRRWLF